MNLGPDGEKLIKGREGEGPHGLGVVYEDEAGIPTFCWGCIKDKNGQPVTMSTPAETPEGCQSLFMRDTSWAIGACNRLLDCSKLTQRQFDAMVDFTFNEGIGALQVCSMRNAINHGMPVTQEMFTRWNKLHVNGVLRVSAGLTRRRVIEWELFSSKG